MYDVVSVAGIAVLVVGVLAIAAIVRSGSFIPNVRWRTCAECGHRPSEHSINKSRCLAVVGGSGDRYDSGGDWIGWWNETYCDCSGYREQKTQ
ncbi:hypothetical protein SBI_00166 [Streptomyces bingchenggensis BCW-1]|uniref:Uncharacterized protein n=1 Tax=Streptomyces bingchenggensis (strain BCW-1) TaxID=749414 RepID=D7BUU6_STRBB|nr:MULTISPECIES: hypothetical protein [Streptomyces]ADI03287.1 hypothetical protein SBI_00166 [Streptomyces bingchenggensis BCW-1]